MRSGFRAGVIGCGLLVFLAAGCRSSAGFRGVPAEGVVQTVEVFYGTDRAAEDDQAGRQAKPRNRLAANLGEMTLLAVRNPVR